MLRIRNFHPLRSDFPDSSPHIQSATARSYYPERALLHIRFGLFPGRSPLLGESLLFSSPGGTKMFQFPPFASVQKSYGCMSFRHAGCPIRKSADQRSFAPTGGLSQLITSFIASVSQGIHLAPFSTFSVDSLTYKERPPLILSAVSLIT